MGLGKILKKMLIYEEPKKSTPFVLLETEEEQDSKAAPDQPSKGTLGSKILKWLRRDQVQPTQEAIIKNRLSKNIQVNLERIKQDFSSAINHDIIIRRFKISQTTEAFITYIEGITDQNTIDNFILRPLLQKGVYKEKSQVDLVSHITNIVLSANQTSIEPDYDFVRQSILSGQTALFVDGYAECILIGTTKFEKRAVSTPLQEFIVLGPNEAFVEDLRTNITLVRQILRNQHLITEILTLTDTNNTKCALLYVKDVINPKIVAEVKRRLESINVDFISDGILSQLIEDHANAILPQVLSTERPDRIAGLLIEGRAAIILEGTPLALVVPITFFDFFRTSEDFSLRWQYSTFLRVIRLAAVISAILLPSLYIALTMYHQEAIPIDLLFSIVKARSNLPFPVILELLLMELSWELIREAGIRVPGIVGQTLGIVGGVILGQAAVAAGLVSPILIIVVAITGLGNFAIPDFSIAFGIRILRFALFLLGSVAGFYGIAVGIVILTGLAASMKSFGVPYLSPIAPKTKGMPVLWTKGVWSRTERQDFLNPQKIKRTYSVIRGWKEQDEKGKQEQ